MVSCNSPSASVSLLTKCAGYRRFAQPRISRNDAVGQASRRSLTLSQPRWREAVRPPQSVTKRWVPCSQMETGATPVLRRDRAGGPIFNCRVPDKTVSPAVRVVRHGMDMGRLTGGAGELWFRVFAGIAPTKIEEEQQHRSPNGDGRNQYRLVHNPVARIQPAVALSAAILCRNSQALHTPSAFRRYQVNNKS